MAKPIFLFPAVVVVYTFLASYQTVLGFTTPTTSFINKSHVSSASSSTNLYNNNNRFDKELEENAERKALQKASGGAGETAAGAILGGLVMGPFGALFGASIGSQFGASRAVDKAKQEELERMGITQGMLEAARDMGAALERGTEGLRATKDSLITQQKFAKRLEMDADKAYEDAQAAITSGNEELARDMLFKRTEIQNKMKKVLMGCVEETQRLRKMEDNVRVLEEKAVEMESLLKRNVGAKAMLDSSTQLSLANEDPLLQKFKDMGID